MILVEAMCVLLLYCSIVRVKMKFPPGGRYNWLGKKINEKNEKCGLKLNPLKAKPAEQRFPSGASGGF